jgi:TonB family protein
MIASLLLTLLAGDAPPAADASSAPPKTPAMIEEVTNDPGRVIERDGVRWREWLFESPVEISRCGARQFACGEKRIVILNESNVVLRCRVVIRYAHPNPYGIRDAVRRIIVPPGKRWIAARSATPLNLPAKSYESDCTSEPPLPALHIPAECTLKHQKAVDSEAYYPQASKDAGEEGPVFIEFSLAASPGPARNIAVIQTSTYPELDAAAARSVAESQYATNCLGQRFRVMVSFRLR